MLSLLRVFVAGATVAMSLALGSSVRGQSSFAYEGFDYGATPVIPQMLAGKDGGAGWAGPWIGINQPTDLISYWPLDFSAWDAGPAAMHGTLGGTLGTYSTDVPTSTNTENAVGNWSLFWSSACLDLPPGAVNQRGFINLNAHIPTVANLHKGSITAWVRTASAPQTGTGAVIAVANSSATGLTDFGVRVSNGKVQWGSRGQLFSGGATLASTTLVDDGFWHHVAVTVDGGGNSVLYIDGVQEATGPSGFFGSVQGINLFSIGRTLASGGNQQGFLGQIDDVAIWGSPLTAADVALLANTGGMPPAAMPFFVAGPMEGIGPSLGAPTLAGAGTNNAFESGGYRAVGNKFSDASGNRAGRLLATGMDMRLDATYYMSCVVRRVDPPSGVITPAEVVLASEDKIGGRFGWDALGNFYAGIDTVVTTGAIAMQPATEYWVILKIVSSSGGMSPQGDDLVFMKAYQRQQMIPDDDTGLSGQGTNPANWTVVVTPGAILGATLNQIWLLQGQAGGSTMEVDEIHIGNTWQSVTDVGYGKACGNGRIGVTNRPILGATDFSINLTGAQANANAFLLLGIAPTSINLGLIGATGCTLLTSAEFSVGTVASGAGAATFPLSIPNIPTLYNQSVYTQWASSVTTGFPLAFSDGYQMLIQK